MAVTEIDTLKRDSDKGLKMAKKDLRTCLQGSGGPQVGEVTRLGWVARLFNLST